MIVSVKIILLVYFFIIQTLFNKYQTSLLISTFYFDWVSPVCNGLINKFLILVSGCAISLG